MRYLKLLSLAALMTLMSAHSAVPQQGGQVAERVPTPRERSDTFPRWQNPTLIRQRLNVGLNPPPNQNPRYFSPNSASDGFSSTAMAVDSRGVVHIAGILVEETGSTDLVKIAYLNNAFATRTASGFSELETLATYQTPYAAQTYGGPGNITMGVAPDGTVHVFWTASWSTTFSGSIGGVQYNEGRVKSDIFRISKGSSGWSSVTQCTSAACTLELEQRYVQLRVASDSAGSMVAMGRREDLTYAWIVNSWQMNSDQAGVYAWPNLLAGGMPTFLEARDPSIGNVATRGQLSPLVTYVNLDVNNRFHVYSRRLTGGAWTAATDVCGAATNDSKAYATGGLDSDGNAHYSWNNYANGNPNQATVVHCFNGGAQSQVSTTNVNAFIPRLMVDSRDQVHVVYKGLVLWQPGGQPIWQPFYAAQVRNPAGPLNTTWRRQDIVAAPVFEQTFDGLIGDSQALLPFQFEVQMGSDDRIHYVDDSCLYACTMEYNLGACDPASAVSVAPGSLANVTTGNLSAHIPLFSTKGVSPNQEVGLVYNSLDSEFGSIAQGWKLNYDVRLIDHGLAMNDPNGPYVDVPTECMTVVMPDGRRIPFGYRTFAESPPSSSYLVAYDEFGFFARLDRTSWTMLGQDFVLTFKDGEKWVFDGKGRLKEMRARSFNCISLTYDQSGRLASIQDQLVSGGGSGRPTVIYYETVTDQRRPYRISSIVDPAGKTYTFAYSGDRLSGVNLPTSDAFGFTYHSTNNPNNGSRAGLLASLVMPRGNSWTFRYRMDGRLISVQDPQALVVPEGIYGQPSSVSPTLNIEYLEPMPLAVEPFFGGTDRVTIVRDRRGEPTRFEYESRRGLVRDIYDATILDANGNPGQGPQGIVPITRTFDDYGNLLSQGDRTGSETNYVYWPPAASPHVRDDLQSISRDGTMLASFNYTSDTFHQVFTATTNASGAGGSRTTTYEYDSAGRVTEINHPSVTLANGTNQSATTTLVYGGPRGALSAVINEENKTTGFSSFHSVHGLPQQTTPPESSQSEESHYDAMGNVTQFRRPQGGTNNDAPGWTYLTLDNRYRVQTVTDPSGSQTTYAYDEDSNLTGVTPPAGTGTTSTFDARGFPSGGTTPDGSWSQWVDANGNLRRVQDLRGFYSDTVYDGLGRVLTQQTEGSGTSGAGGGGPAVQTVDYVYDTLVNNQRVVTITQGGTGANPRTTTQVLDGWGRVVAVDEPDGSTRSEHFYDQQSNLLATQSRFSGTLQSCVVYYRDARDRVFQTRRQNTAYGSGASWFEDTFSIFNKTGAVVQSVGPRGDPTNASDLTDKVNYELDSRGRVFRVLQPSGGQMVIVQETVYGDDDLPIETKIPDPTGLTQALVTGTKYTYTARKETKTVKNSSDYGLTYLYTANHGQVDTVTNAQNLVTKTTYHAGTQRVNEIIEAYGSADPRRTVHVWNAGMLTEKHTWNPVSQAENAVWSYAYDRAGRLERLQAPQSAAEVYSYSAFSEKTGIVAGQRSEARTYNSMGRELTRTVTGAFSGQITSMYDGSGNLSQLNDGTLRKDIAWDVAAGRPTSEWHYVGGLLWKAQSYGYDDAGNLNSMTYPDPVSTAHEWIRDEANRITGIRVGGTEVCSMAYTPGGVLRLTTLRSASGASIAQTLHDYDSLGRHVRAHTTRTGSQATLSDIRWEYDTLDRVNKIRLYHLGVVTDIGYNVRGEVTSEITTGNGSGMEPPPFTNIFGGAPTGNDSDPSAEVAVTPGSVLSVANRSASYAYDKGGNRISQTIDGVTTTLTYDSENRLITETRSGWSVDHEYDAWGNEIERTTTTSGSTTIENYGYNAMNRMSSYARTVGGNLQANWQYDYWPSGERYSKTNLVTNVSQRFVCHGDNVVAEYGVTGGVITLQNTYAQGLGLDQKSLRIPASGGRIHYLGDKVGTLTSTLTDSGFKAEECFKDIWGNSLSGDTNDERYGFAQREYDMESGLVYMRHRMYDPRIGRFTQMDQMLGNRPHEHYRYAANDTVHLADPTGLYPQEQVQKLPGQEHAEKMLAEANAIERANGGPNTASLKLKSKIAVWATIGRYEGKDFYKLLNLDSLVRQLNTGIDHMKSISIDGTLLRRKGRAAETDPKSMTFDSDPLSGGTVFRADVVHEAAHAAIFFAGKESRMSDDMHERIATYLGKLVGSSIFDNLSAFEEAVGRSKHLQGEARAQAMQEAGKSWRTALKAATAEVSYVSPGATGRSSFKPDRAFVGEVDWALRRASPYSVQLDTLTDEKSLRFSYERHDLSREYGWVFKHPAFIKGSRE